MSASIATSLPVSSPVQQASVQKEVSLKREEIAESIVTKLSSSVSNLYIKYQDVIERMGTQFASCCRSGITSLSKFSLFPLKISNCGQKIQNAIANELGFLVEKVILLFTHLIKDLPTIAVIIGIASLLAFCVQASSSLFIASISTATYLAYTFFESKFHQQKEINNQITSKLYYHQNFEERSHEIVKTLFEYDTVQTNVLVRHEAIISRIIDATGKLLNSTLATSGLLGLILYAEIRYQGLSRFAFLDNAYIAAFASMSMVGVGGLLYNSIKNSELKNKVISFIHSNKKAN